MVEGPNAELSPVYPKKLQPVRPAEAQNNTVSPGAVSSTAARTETAQKPLAETTGAAARSDDPGKTAAKPETVQKQGIETAVAAAGADDPSKTKSAPANIAHNAQAYASQPNQNKRDEATSSNNRCDVQACASAYKSFRASDCTYQPFGGERRVCGKAPEQRADREQRNEPQRRSWSRREDSEDSRDADRRPRWRVYDEDDDEDDVILFRRSRRW
jgi:hypothetical protein